MKTKTTFTLLLVALTMGAFAQQREVALPPSVHSNTTSVEIRRATLADTATVLDIDAFFRPGWWIKIASDSYLQADGKKYAVRRGEGIDLDSLFWMPASGEASFKLVFEPLPQNTQTFDFIESDCDNCFKIWGVDLVNKRIPLPQIPQEYRQLSKQDTGIPVAWQKGKAVVSGRLLGYGPQIKEEFHFLYINPVSGQEKKTSVQVKADGTFRGEVELLSPARITLALGAARLTDAPVAVAPGKETKVLINLPELNRAKGRLHKDDTPYGKTSYFGGYFAGLNNELSDGHLKTVLAGKSFMNDVVGLDGERYYNYNINLYHSALQHNDSLAVSPLAKKIASSELFSDLFRNMFSMESILVQAYAEKNKIDYRNAFQAMKMPVKPDNFDDFYRLASCDAPEVLMTASIGQIPMMLNYAGPAKRDDTALFSQLAADKRLTKDEKNLVDSYLSIKKKGEVFPHIDSLALVVNKYLTSDDQMAIMQKQMGAQFLSKVWNTNDCFLLDLVKANALSRKMVDFYPLTDEQKATLSDFPAIIREELLLQNDKLLAVIEENKKKTGYTILDMPAAADENLFTEMMKPFKGKAVLVDIWATWCGPCRMANKEMAPLKAQLADSGLVYVYLAGENSPEGTWRNMIPDLKGYHYRMSDANWGYLGRTLKAEGVPTYIVLDKEGNQTFHSVGFPGVDEMKKELKKVLGE
ncbi:MAG TPA: hypothetical protein DDW85_01180 [Porphyromonadaceae bacterium]|nr:hypothetical protein [Porphyromonadaceae bacterium]